LEPEEDDDLLQSAFDEIDTTLDQVFEQVGGVMNNGSG